MKLIKLNESQYKRLFEGNIETFGQNSNPEYFDQGKVSCQSARLQDKDGVSTVEPDPVGGFKKGPDGKWKKTGLDQDMSARSSKVGLRGI